MRQSKTLINFVLIINLKYFKMLFIYKKNRAVFSVKIQVMKNARFNMLIKINEHKNIIMKLNFFLKICKR